MEKIRFGSLEKFKTFTTTLTHITDDPVLVAQKCPNVYRKSSVDGAVNLANGIYRTFMLGELVTPVEIEIKIIR